MKTNKLIRFLVFLFFNFSALGVGVILMDNGPLSDWYASLNQAPWTPANWVFGTAWSTVMFCFTFYMAKLSFQFPFLDRKLILLYTTQWLLNVSWNFAFFNNHNILIGLIIIVLLTLLICYFLIKNLKNLRLHTLLIVPYFIWILIATSLNAYIFFNN